jgi:hypothetical protein
MSTKRKYIQEANLISEQRYINNKFLMEVETPQTTTQTSQPQQVATQTSQQQQTEVQTDQPVKTTQDLTNMGINVVDTTTQQSILRQLQPHSDKINLGELQSNLGKKEFFDVLKKYVTLEPEKDSKPESAKSPTETKTITGEKAKLQIGNFTFNTTFDFKDKNIGDVGLQYKTKVGNTPTTLMLKAKDPGSVGTGDFGLKNIQAGVKINIPQTNKNKPHGAML